MILAYREKTGCKQYIFQDIMEMRKYFAKKWYKGEHIKYFEYSDETNREIGSGEIEL